jgi:phosphosulfolactate synthase
MNYNLTFIPARTKNLASRVNMVIGQRISLTRLIVWLKAVAICRFFKTGFGTSLVTNNLKEKVKLYKDAGLRPYLVEPCLRYL